MNIASDATTRPEPVDIAVATGNPGKLAEIRTLLGPAYRIHSAQDLNALLPEETGLTFADNAILKAAAVADQTGMIAIADDSGLEVVALDGAPGVHTARYAGNGATDEANRHKLLAALAESRDANRSARFVSVIAIAFGPNDVVTAEGTCEGTIALEERGQAGFGYDSVFQLPSGKTMAELTPDEKNAISHRGRAMALARELLERRGSYEPASPKAGS